jgi:hypothetical protein
MNWKGCRRKWLWPIWDTDPAFAWKERKPRETDQDSRCTDQISYQAPLERTSELSIMEYIFSACVFCDFEHVADLDVHLLQIQICYYRSIRTTNVTLRELEIIFSCILLNTCIHHTEKHLNKVDINETHFALRGPTYSYTRYVSIDKFPFLLHVKVDA